ncbi:hypothetical protein FT663_04141 [Candidozyma haemuli var. vulneris]|nr:hypothetical protein FT662_04846 [[Candida] haemuloni var. vulneris]KAF3988171.1 hypothetical protein FT663_04141 [[Candida] haemuloni var. vulneris]
MTQGKCKPDRVWSIEGQHEVVFKQTWAAYLKSFGYDLDDFSFSDIEGGKKFVSGKAKNALPKVSDASAVSAAPKFTERTQKTFEANQGKALTYEGTYDVKAKAPSKEVYSHLAKFKPAELHQAFWASLRNDSPDNNMLRFVRARKFKLNAIVDMAAKCLEWKVKEYPVDKWTMDGDLEIYDSKKHPEIIKAFEMEKAYFRGVDRDGGPIVVIRVKKHFGSDCPEKDFERFICLIIEWVRIALKDYELGNDGANILFDMNGFSLKNADLSAVKFLAKAFEANYPESLSAIWIHKAPWIFNAVWKIIKGWLDPVVASKVHFTKNADDLAKFADKKFIPKDLGGNDDYKPEYIKPTKENAGTLPKDEKFEQLWKDRQELTYTFIETTLAWIKAKSAKESTELLDLKIQLGAELAKNYLELDPYIRSRGVFDRDGAIGTPSF